jgi:hypothetical protein
MATRSITIELSGVPAVALRKNKASQTHWRYRQREAKAMREMAYMLILNDAGLQRLPLNGILPLNGQALFAKASIHITQHYCGKPLDHESLASGVSPAIDAYIDAGVIEDDAPVKYITDYRLAYHRERHKSRRKVVIEVREVQS